MGSGFLLNVFLIFILAPLFSSCGGKHAPATPPFVTPSEDDTYTPDTSGSDEGSDDPNPNTPNPNDSVEPKFASIKTKIFDRSCLSCHSFGGKAANVPLATIDDLLNSPRDLVIPKDPDESGLMIALLRNDSKRMPPPDSGLPPITEKEISIVRQWIQEGATQ